MAETKIPRIDLAILRQYLHFITFYKNSDELSLLGVI